MPKFRVKMLKDFWKKTWIEVDAADYDDAENQAVALVEADEKGEIIWHPDDTSIIGEIMVDVIEQEDAA